MPKTISRQKKNLPGIPVLSNMPQGIIPMALTMGKKAFDHDDWHFEIKWDGFRILSYCDNENVRLRSRNDADFTKRFSVISNELKQFNLNAIFDGEVVTLNEEGCSDFGKLLGGEQDCLVYYVFDLLWYDGVDLRDKPLIERRELLEHILPKSNLVRFSDHILAKGTQLFKAIQGRKIEGIVAKHKDSRYESGKRSKNWIKIKVCREVDVVIAGVVFSKSAKKSYFSSLVIGRMEKDQFRYIGLVSSGVSEDACKGL